MKITTLQENLKNGLNIVSHIAGKNINLPILNNVMIKAEKGNINLITTDLEIGVVSAIRGKVEKEGVFTVDSKVIADYISLLDNKKVDIEKKEKNLLVKCDNYKTTINGQAADDFPLIPQVDKNSCFKAKIDEFKDALSQVIFAVSANETKIELSGVFFYFTKEMLVMAATDSYRLAEKTVKITSDIKEEKKVIIPAKTLLELIRIVSMVRKEDLSDDNEISFYLSDSQIVFNVGSTDLVSRVIEGQYPDYKQIVPADSKTEVNINRQELLRAVKASAIFSKSGINDINLDFPAKKNKVIISSTSSQTGENIVELDANVRGEDNGIVVNYRYLLDGLNNINSENVILKIVNSNTPCILNPESEDAYLYIIMPIKQ